MQTIISVNNLSKNFKDATALDNISFEVRQNEIFGLVGPDGAGKSTTIRILTCLIEPESGEINILGYNHKKEQKKIKKEIGYLSQRFSLYGDLTVDENIEFFADIHGIGDFRKRRDELLDYMRLTSFREFHASQLSGGMKQKLSLACTLIHTPKILFLDEPTTGVDPVSRRDFWKILSGLLKEGITIVITTPYLDEAERFSRIALMNHGRIIKCDTPVNIKNSLNKIILEVICDDIRRAFKILADNSYDVQLFGDRLDIITESSESTLNKAADLLEQNKIGILDKRIKPVSLENVFINLLKSA